MKSLLATFLIVLTLISTTVFAFPQPAGFVNDYANILTDRPVLEQALSDYEQNTTIEIAVVTLDSVPEGYTLFSYGVELFADWGIGKKGEDNGILVLIVRNGTVGNRMRIELGYGIQGYITGSEAGRILDDAMPYYQAGDYQSVTEIILSGLSDRLVDYVPGNVRDNSIPVSLPPMFFIYIVIFGIIVIGSIAMRNRCPYCIRGKLKCTGDKCVCQRCGKKFSKHKRFAPVVVGGGFGGGFGGGGGGFGGGGSGGGGAGR